MKNTLKIILFLLILAALVCGLVTSELYQMDIYHRKYPGTTTWDYLLDHHR